MSRVAKKPIPLPSGVKVEVNGQNVSISGPKGLLSHTLHQDVSVTIADGVLTMVPTSDAAGPRAQAGTARAVLNNIVEGVSKGYERKLEIVGVGYRAQAKGQTLSLTLGFSHPVEFPVPAGIAIETPTQTEILIKGVDKQLVGQVAANIRAYRKPEPYKGKGVKYANEKILRKEAKKT